MANQLSRRPWRLAILSVLFIVTLSLASSPASEATNQFQCSSRLATEEYTDNLNPPSVDFMSDYTDTSFTYKNENLPYQSLRVWWCWNGKTVKDGQISSHMVFDDSLQAGFLDKVEAKGSSIQQVGTRYVVVAVAEVEYCIHKSYESDSALAAGAFIFSRTLTLKTDYSSDLCPTVQMVSNLELCANGRSFLTTWPRPDSTNRLQAEDHLDRTKFLDEVAEDPAGQCTDSGIETIDGHQWRCGVARSVQNARQVPIVELDPISGAPSTGVIYDTIAGAGGEASHAMAVWWCWDGQKVRDGFVVGQSAFQANGLDLTTEATPIASLNGQFYVATGKVRSTSCVRSEVGGQAKTTVGSPLKAIIGSAETDFTDSSATDVCLSSEAAIELELCPNGVARVKHVAWIDQTDSEKILSVFSGYGLGSKPRFPAASDYCGPASAESIGL